MTRPTQRTGLLLVNLGTPDAPDKKSVRRYLREFLSDPRVLDISPVGRWLLLNFIILPRRPAASAEAYRAIWTERGSPLLVYSQELARKVEQRLGDDVIVELAMRYQNPSIASGLQRLRRAGAETIVVFPLFPQYASASTGSAVEKVCFEACRLWNVPYLQIVPAFYAHPAFIHAFAAVAAPVLEAFAPDAVLMSFHGLPERHVVKSDEHEAGRCLRAADCCERIGIPNRSCYRAQCFATARALAETLDISNATYEVTFQSRLGRDPWIKPYTDEVVIARAKAGAKRLAVLCPAFVADCLETLEEIGIRAREDFIAAGGQDLRLVPSLNSTDVWADAVVEIMGDTFVPGEADGD